MSAFLDLTGLGEVIDKLDLEIGKKVDKESGKGLSANDFTNELKTKLENVAQGATKVTVDGALSDVSENPVQNKIVKAAIDKKMDKSLKGAANGVAELGADGKILSSQLPGSVDEIVEGYLSAGKFYKESGHTNEIKGEVSKIYIDLSTEKTYRYSGSGFVEISASLALGDTSNTAYRGDHGKAAYDHSLTAHAPANAEANQNAFSKVTVGSVAVNAGAKTDNITIVQGTNVTLTADASNKKITIAAKDTTYKNATADTAGLMSGTDKAKLDGIRAITTAEIDALFAV